MTRTLKQTSAQFRSSVTVFRAIFGTFGEARQMATKAHKEWPALAE
jgi:hypothetical protein